MYLGWVAHDGGSARTQPLLDDDVSRQLGGEQHERFLHDFLDVHGNALADSAAAEREDAFDQRIPALAGDHDVLDIVAQGAAGADVAKRHLSIAQDHAEKIVEVVRNATREVTEGLKTLSLTQLTLDTLQVLLGDMAIRHVEHESDHACWFTFPIEESSSFCMKPPDSAAGVKHAIFSVEIARLQSGLDRVAHVRPVFGVDELPQRFLSPVVRA